MKLTKEPTLTVIVDSRENNPLLFNGRLLWYPDLRKNTPAVSFKLQHEVAALSAGDYAIKGYESVAAVERKGSVDELMQNLVTEDRRRFDAAWSRLVALPHKWLLLDIPWRKLTKAYKAEQPEQLLDGIQRIALETSVPIMYGGNATTVPDRERLGCEVARLLWNAVYLHHQAAERQALRPAQGASICTSQ